MARVAPWRPTQAGIRAEGERVAGLLGLRPLPDEGGLYRQTFADAHSSVIYYLLLAPDFSALHRLSATESVYHWYAGTPLRLLLLHGDSDTDDTDDTGDAGDGQVDEPVLGPDLDAGSGRRSSYPRGRGRDRRPCKPAPVAIEAAVPKRPFRGPKAGGHPRGTH